MLYMIVEKFRGNAVPIYRRFRDRGRLAPDGLRYVSSWVTPDLARCFQVMETDDPALLEQWMEQWKDLAEFEVVPVVTRPRPPRASRRGCERRDLEPVVG